MGSTYSLFLLKVYALSSRLSLEYRLSTFPAFSFYFYSAILKPNVCYFHTALEGTKGRNERKERKEGNCSPVKVIMAHINGLCILNLFYSAFFSMFLFLCVHGCPPLELNALLSFKAEVHDAYGILESWEGYECCRWRGVECDDTEMGSPVSKLDLHGFKLTTQNGGLHKVSWLLELKHLKYLDLGGNAISVGRPLPPGLGSLTNLTYLDMSVVYAHTYAIPANPCYRSCTPIPVDSDEFPRTGLRRCRKRLSRIDVSLTWLASLSSLKYLSLNNVDLHRAEDNWGNVIGSLSLIKHLSLSRCGLPRSAIPGSFFNLSSLVFLDLSGNGISGSIPSWMRIMSRLTSLNLSSNCLEGSIPNSLGELRFLRYLDLSSNRLSGSIPLSFAQLNSLTYLNVSNNQLNESIPSSLSLPPSLQELYLSNNKMDIGGPVSEQILFQKTSKMIRVDLADSRLSINISLIWIPPFQLRYLSLRRCNIGGPIPGWISTQFRLQTLDLTGTKLVGILPSWLWEFSSDLTTLHLSDNHLEGPFSPTLTSLQMFDLSMNELSGHLMEDIDEHLLSANALVLADNKFEGKIPASLGNISYLYVLDLSGNLFTGNIPASLGGFPSLEVLRLENNSLDGEIPKDLGNLESLKSFRIGKNKLQGLLPPTLSSLSDLLVFDVGENNFTGDIPDWIAEFSNLQVLVMRSNNFKGKLPPQIGQMPSLQILDLSSNLLSGEIPDAYLNFTAMNQVQQNISKLGDDSRVHYISDSGVHYISYGALKRNYVPCRGDPGKSYYSCRDDTFSAHSKYYVDGLKLHIKGENLRYEYVLSSLTCIDLSNNRLWGHLPPGIGNLEGLMYLNLNKNYFNGPIPGSVGNLGQLESLDLSVNNFSGQIPSQIGALNYLAFLNLSYNNLSGRIPEQGGQMATFDNSSYLGNPNLWGCPLERKCPRRHPQLSPDPSPMPDEEEKNEGFPWYWMSFGLSVGMGFSTVVMVLTLKVGWRNKCFQLMDRGIAVLFAKLLNW